MRGGLDRENKATFEQRRCTAPASSSRARRASLYAFSAPTLNVGCSGWFYWHWRGPFYADDAAPDTWFDHYAQHFSTVELNAPFYSWPTIATVKSWMRLCAGETRRATRSRSTNSSRTPNGSKAPNASFGISATSLICSARTSAAFCSSCRRAFTISPARLAAIVAQLDPRRRNVVEFRHRSWWNRRRLRGVQKGRHHLLFVQRPATARRAHQDRR